MSATQSTTSQAITIYSNTKGSSPGSESNSKQVSIAWDTTKWALKSAQLVVSASQGWQSGASLQFLLNNQSVGELDWGAFDVSQKESTFDVSSALSNGANTFALLYNAAYYAWPGIGAGYTVFSAVLNLEFNYIGGSGSGGSTPPSGTSPPVSTNPVSGLTTTQMLEIAGASIVVAVLIAVLVRRR